MSRALRSNSRAEWLAKRRIGASDVAAIVGRSPYKTGWDVWLRLTGQAEPQPQTQAMARGVRWEPIVLDLYATETGLPIRRTPEHTTWVRDDRPYLSATPDAFTLDGGRRGGVEAKTDVHVAEYGEPTVIDRWTPEAAAVVRPVYALQTYSQLAVVDELDFVDLAVLLPFYELRVYRFERDPDVDASLVDTVGAWYERHVVGREPPEIDGSYECRGYLAGQFPQRSDLRPGTDQELELATRIAQLDVELKAAKDAKDLASAQLQALIGDAAGVAWGPPRKGQPKALVVRSKGRSTLDEKGLVEAHPNLREVLAQHTRQGAPYAYVRTYGFNAATTE